MLHTLCLFVFKRTYKRFIKNQEKFKAYRSNLGTWETRLNDESRMLINSIRGSVDAEKFINQGQLNIDGFVNHIKNVYPKFYNSKMFQTYNKRIIYLQGKVRYEKQIINKHKRWFNEDVQNHPFLAKIWGFKVVPYEVWNDGRDVPTVSKEYNKVNHQQFREHYGRSR